MLEQMQGVMRLELSGCNDFTEAGLWSSLNARITSLSVSDCINVADDAIAAISQLLPNLTELNLQAYHVTDTALAYFTAKQGYTTHTLRLNSCWEITNHGVVNMVHSLPNLSTLSLSGCSKVTDDGVELVAENLRKLRSLDLSWCPRITDMALEYIACDLHKLEELVLDRYVGNGSDVDASPVTLSLPSRVGLPAYVTKTQRKPTIGSPVPDQVQRTLLGVGGLRPANQRFGLDLGSRGVDSRLDLQLKATVASEGLCVLSLSWRSGHLEIPAPGNCSVRKQLTGNYQSAGSKLQAARPVLIT